jgi:GlpG protein
MPKSLKITFDSPVTLILAVTAFTILIIEQHIMPGITLQYFSLNTMNHGTPWQYMRIITHIFGHASPAQLFGNLFIILLLGPILEDKYGSSRILAAIFATALITTAIQISFIREPIMGASGIVLLYIILASAINLKKGAIPLSFILVFLIFIGGGGLLTISQFSHIVGGIGGAAVVLAILKKQKSAEE